MHFSIESRDCCSCSLWLQSVGFIKQFQCKWWEISSRHPLCNLNQFLGSFDINMRLQQSDLGISSAYCTKLQSFFCMKFPRNCAMDSV